MLEALRNEALRADPGLAPAGPGSPAAAHADPSARAALAAEVLRAAGSALLAPARTALFLTRVGDLRRDLCADLESARAVEDAPAPRELPARALRFLISSAEP